MRLSRILASFVMAFVAIGSAIPAYAAGGNPPRAIPVASISTKIGSGTSAVVEEIPAATMPEMVEVIPHLQNQWGWFDPMEIQVVFGQQGKTSIAIKTEQKNALYLRTTGSQQTTTAIASIPELVWFNYDSKQVNGFTLAYYAGALPTNLIESYFYTVSWRGQESGPTIKLIKGVGWTKTILINTSSQDLLVWERWSGWFQLARGDNIQLWGDLVGTIYFSPATDRTQIIGGVWWDWERLMPAPEITMVDATNAYPGGRIYFSGKNFFPAEVSVGRLILVYNTADGRGGGVYEYVNPGTGMTSPNLAWSTDGAAFFVPGTFLPQTVQMNVIVGEKVSNRVTVAICALTRTADSRCN